MCTSVWAVVLTFSMGLLLARIGHPALTLACSLLGASYQIDCVGYERGCTQHGLHRFKRRYLLPMLAGLLAHEVAWSAAALMLLQMARWLSVHLAVGSRALPAAQSASCAGLLLRARRLHLAELPDRCLHACACHLQVELVHSLAKHASCAVQLQLVRAAS